MKGRLLAGLALGAFFLWLSLRDVPFPEIWEAMRQADPWYFILFLALNVLIFWARAVRWSLLLGPVASIPSRRLVSPLCIGLMSNFIFPARAGEFIRAYLVGEREKVSKSSVFATVVVERLFDGLAIFSFLGLAPFFLSSGGASMPPLLKKICIMTPLVYVTLLLVLLVLSHHPELIYRYLVNSAPARRWRLVRKVVEIVQKFTEGLAVLKSASEVFAALALSLLVWVPGGIINFVMFKSVGLELPLYAAFFLLVMQSFGVMVPSPGFLGSYQYANRVALSLYGIPKADALALAFLLHAGFFIVYIGAGLFFVFREHLSWRDLEEASSKKDP